MAAAVPDGHASTKDWDVKGLMPRVLETQKGYVREDLTDYSCTMVVVFRNDGTSYLQFPTFDDQSSKDRAYFEVVAQAKREGAVVIMTINDALTSPNVREDYQWGDLNQGNSQTCILITASGPGMHNVMLQCAYRIEEEAVLFGEPEFTT